MRYHIRRDGTPGVCFARPGHCPLADEEHHYDNIQDAQAEADKQNADFFVKKTNGKNIDTDKKVSRRFSKDKYTKEIKDKSMMVINAPISRLKVNGFSDKIGACEVYRHKINYKNFKNSRHYEVERKQRRKVYDKYLGSGQHYITLKVNRNGEEYLYDINDNGRVKIISYYNKVVVTEIAMNEKRISYLLRAAHQKIPLTLMENATIGHQLGDRELILHARAAERHKKEKIHLRKKVDLFK